jgi:hypothetical protein
MDTALDWLRRLCSWIAIRMVARPGLYSLLSLLVVVVLSLGYAQLQPRYRLADQVPDRQRAVQASNRLDVKLTGANPFDVYIQFPKGASLYDSNTLDALPTSTPCSSARRGSAMSGRSIRCGAGSPRK